MNKPKIAMFVPSMRPGGAEKVFANLSGLLVDQGVDVDLLLAQHTGPNLKHIDPRVNVIDLRASRIVFALFPLMKYLRQQKPDAIMSTLTHANVITCIAHKITRSTARLVLREAAQPNTNKASLDSGATGRILSIAKRVYPWADVIVSVSSGVKQAISEALSIEDFKNHLVVHNPTSLNAHNEQTTVELPEHHRDWFDSPVVLAIGRLAEVKRYDTLIKAFAHLRQRRSCRLLILGTGALEAELKALVHQLNIEQDVMFGGYSENPYPYLKQAAVFVLSSRSEGMPNAMIEALSAGTSVVSTDIPNGPAEILENGRWGRLVPVGDDTAMATAIEQAMDDPISVPADDPWWRRFSETEITQQYMKILLPNRTSVQ